MTVTLLVTLLGPIVALVVLQLVIGRLLPRGVRDRPAETEPSSTPATAQPRARRAEPQARKVA